MTKTTKTNRTLKKGTRVRKANGQTGRIAMVFQYRWDGPAKSYMVDTPSSREIWMASRIQVCR